jgi:hypothetical protein
MYLNLGATTCIFGVMHKKTHNLIKLERGAQATELASRESCLIKKVCANRLVFCLQRIFLLHSVL